jgi:hypothetical protein
MDTSNAKLVSGLLSDHEALGVGGDPIYRAAEQIRTLLQKELGESVSQVFAIPVRNDKTNELDWYSPIQGNALPLQQLSPEEQAKAKEIIATRFASIDQFGSRLKNEIGTEAARTYASLLDSAKSYPNDEQVFVINGQPVITFWGFKNNPLLKAAGLKASMATPVTPLPMEQSSNQSAKRSWWQRFGWWLVLAALLLFGIPAVLKSCGTDFPLYKQNAEPLNCPQVDTTPANCKEEVKPVVPKPPEKQVLSPEALKKNDLSVFEGKWVLTSDLFNASTGQKISINLDLDKSGQGTGHVFDNTQGKCSGSTYVKISGAKNFQVTQDAMRCSINGGWQSNMYNCTVRPNHVQADCDLTCTKKSGERYTCNSVFEKR